MTDANAVAGTATISVPVNRAPTAGFTLSPQTPRVGETVTFTSAATDDVALPAATPTGPVTWDLDNDGQFDDGTGNSVTRAYGAAGDQVVRMRVVDAGGLATIGTKTFPVQQFLPTASFTSSPAHPLPGQTVTFRSTSAPSQGAQITNQEWDLDGISGIDATGAVVTTIYRTAGRRTVTLKVTDTQGFDIATAPVAVNAPPSAAFRASPTQPYVGDAVTFASVSGDPDGPLPTEAWDLDGDGQYDDATGKTASRTFTTAGAHTVRLRVIDSAGAAGAATLTLNVRPPPGAPGHRAPAAGHAGAGHQPARPDEHADPDPRRARAAGRDGEGEVHRPRLPEARRLQHALQGQGPAGEVARAPPPRRHQDHDLHHAQGLHRLLHRAGGEALEGHRPQRPLPAAHQEEAGERARREASRPQRSAASWPPCC